MIRLLTVFLLALPQLALAYPFLTGYDEAPNVAAAPSSTGTMRKAGRLR